MSYKKITGIYQIKNISNNKLYIGSAISILSRFNQHKRLLNKGIHFNNHLQAAWNKYGEQSFSFDLISETSAENLRIKEEYYIQKYQSNLPNIGYNKRLNCETNRGIKASEITKQKLSISHLGHKRSEESNKKIIESQYKEVCQLDRYGNLITIFKSMMEAEEKTGVTRQSISACCRKVLIWAGSYYWCYKKDLETFILVEPKQRKGGWLNGIRKKRI